MNGKLLIGSLLLLVSSLVVLSPAAQAAGIPYFLAYGLGDTGLGYGCCGYGPNLPSPAPYFAMHPPVYYSYPVAYPYGYSPFPNPPGVVMCQGAAADPQTSQTTHPPRFALQIPLCPRPTRRRWRRSGEESSCAEGHLSSGDRGKIAVFWCIASIFAHFPSDVGRGVGIIALDTGGKKP